MNTVCLIGRACQDIELKTTTSGIPVCSFKLAVPRSYVKQGDERDTDFFVIVAWRQTAEFLSKYFHKGSAMAIEGTLQSREYEKDGQKRTAIEVVANRVSFCEKKADSVPAPAAAAQESIAYDELPF